MHYFDRSQRVKVLRGKLVREVYAVPKGRSDKPFAVFREWEDGRRESRNIYSRSIAGWLFAAPGDRFEYGSGHVCVEPWCQDAPKDDFCFDYLTADEEAVVAEAHPEFRWCLRKAVAADFNGAEVFALLRAFREAPAVELLVGAGLKLLSLSRGFRRLSRPLQRRVVAWCEANGDYSLECALGCLKHCCAPSEWLEWRSIRNSMEFGFDSFEYCIKRKVPVLQYKEYFGAAESVGKDLSDPYWRFPSDFRARRRTVERIVANRKAAETKAKQKALRKIAERFEGVNVGSIAVWVPSSYAEIQCQARVLHQCLIDMDYPSHVAEGECVLVFMADDQGRPLATAELIPAGKGYEVGQFYGDESKDDYLAGEDEKAALKAWAKANKVKLKFGRAA